MKIGNRKIDHLVYAVPDLEQAMDWFEEKSGIRPIFGGYHTTQGTKNALVNLGDGCYLEFIAIDIENTKIQPPRWMGVDLIKQPIMTRWAIKSTQMELDRPVLQAFHPKMGQISGGQRQTTSGELLKWQLTMPLPSPAVEVIPFAIDWQYSETHPTKSLQQKCSLLDLEIGHPNVEILKEVLQKLELNITISKKRAPEIIAKIQTPNGVIELR